MKLVSKSFLLVTLSAAALFTGCTKKPVRPDPSSTVIGPNTGGNINPLDVSTAPDPSSGLQQRDPNIIENDDMIKGLLGAVYFDFDKSSIAASERPKLDAAKEYLAKNPQYRLLLEGHADWRGTSEYNLGLGDRRANAAKKYLATAGVAAAKLESNSKGSEESKKGGTDEDMKKDRRVEIIVLKK